MSIGRVQAHTDIRDRGWVARLPAGWRPYALLMRLDRPIGAWLLFLPGLWAIALAAPDAGTGARLALLFAAGSVVMRGAGCVVNDLWDRDLDRQVARTAARPLAAGTVSTGEALAFLALLLAAGLAVLVQLDGPAIALGALALVPVALYPLAKRVTDWPQAVLGLTFGWGAPLGLVACTGRLGWETLALHAAAFAWILGYDTVYAHQDREDDARIGVRSTALTVGRATRPFVAACYAACLALVAAAGWRLGVSWPFWPALALPALLLARQVRALDIDDPGLCLALFKANREAGLAIALACLAGRW